MLTLRSMAARIRFLLDQTAELDPELLALVNQHPAGPALLGRLCRVRRRPPDAP